MLCPSCGTNTPAPLQACPTCGTGVPQSPDSLAAVGVAVSDTLGYTVDASSATTKIVLPPPIAHAELHPGDRFGPRYRVLKLLGMGGMGAVYHAWDDELAQAVALKVIRPEYADRGGTESERQFKRELVLARQVTHKHVIRIHDLGEVGGVKYISMPYVEGADLARTLLERGRLPIAEALRLARHVAEGLQAAHEVGVVHRDLKPANILIGAEGALITDFGIAHSTSGPTDGGVLGTIRYMAPEQAQGLDVDHRADQYAFGLILYEMIAGQQWSKDATTMTLFSAKLEGTALPVPGVAAGLPDGIAAILSRCVAISRDGRYATTADLVAALHDLDDEGHPLPKAVIQVPASWPLIGGRTIARGTAVALLALVIAVPVTSGSAYLVSSYLSRPVVQPPPVSILVTDIENRTGEAVFNGVTEQALGVALEGAPFITVYPRADAERLIGQIAQGTRLDLDRGRLVAQREGINVILAGFIAREDDGYRITVNTIDPVPGTVLETASVTASRDEVLSRLGQLGSDVRSLLGDTSPESARIAERETFTAASLEAASLYTQGQALLAAGKYGEAIPLYQKATALDPAFGRAYSSWAASAWSLGRTEEAESLYKRAFSVIDRMTEHEKYRLYGSYYLTVARSYDRAIENYTTLVELYPADYAGHSNLAVAYFYVLNFAKAVEHGQKALALYPASLKQRNNYALYAMYGGDFATARRESEAVLKADPQYFRAYVPKAIAMLDGGRDAVAAVYREMSTRGEQAASAAAMGVADLSMYYGQYADAIAALQPAIAADDKHGNRAGTAGKLVAVAEAEEALGRRAQARQAIARALEISRDSTVLVAAARLQLAAGQEAQARALASELGSRLDSHSRVYARIVEAELALAAGATVDAVDALQAAQKIADLWLVRFVRGQAYLQAQRYPEALAEFEACLKRRGEATAVFLDDVPSVRYLSSLDYWLGRSREGVGLAKQAEEGYRRFLQRHEHGGLAEDARRRVAALAS
jgi:eukaryotic-like serine/threonine-protein kinase